MESREDEHKRLLAVGLRFAFVGTASLVAVGVATVGVRDTLIALGIVAGGVTLLFALLALYGVWRDMD